MKKLFLICSILISITGSGQEIISDNADLADAFTLAVQTVDLNTRKGILSSGADGQTYWTRDNSINSWNGVSLLRPKVAEQTLWCTTINRDTIGHQYWDKIIWIAGAFNHYQVTGDKDFLKQAYRCSANTMDELEKTVFDKDYGLFTGGSVFNDGIAGYDAPTFDCTNLSPSIWEAKDSKVIKCLSTNCVYYGAYLALAEMGNGLHENVVVVNKYKDKADNLKSSILKHLYNEKENKFYYLVNSKGGVDKYQEALGVSFAIIFNVISKEKAYGMTKNVVVSKFGITSIYPDFPRFSKEFPGRHNNMIWPMVNGFYAKAAVHTGNYDAFTTELNGLTHLALDGDKGDYDFREVYNPYTGVPDGGWQNYKSTTNVIWPSAKHQTWSATAYINMVLNGLIGFRFKDDSFTFSPFLPSNVHYIQLKKLHYRNAVLDIIVFGQGQKVKTFLVNGKKRPNNTIDSSIEGVTQILIQLEE